jgi:phage I-like protein
MSGKLRAVELTNGTISVLLAMPAGDEPPTEIKIFGKGVTETTKGPILFDEQAGKSVMKAFREHGLDLLPFDVGHGMVNPFSPPSGHEAFGWFKPAVRDGALYATDIEWTEEALDALKKRKFRYFSPAIIKNYDSGRPEQLINIALTNIPATKGQKPLVADQTEHQSGITPGKRKPMELEEFLKMLGVTTAAEALSRHTELSSLQTGLLALTSAKDTGAAMATLSAWKQQAEQATVLATKVQELEAAGANAKRDQLIEKLSQDGKLADALKPWAKTLTLDALEAFGKSAPVSAVATPEIKEPKDGEKPADITTLSATELKVIRQSGITAEDFLKEKNRLAQIERARLQQEVA